MKKAKLLMAIACLLFFSALAYTNWLEKKKGQKTENYGTGMEEIKE